MKSAHPPAHSFRGMDDGVVSLTSASAGFAVADIRARVLPYCHITPGFSTLFDTVGMSCTAARGIADIDTPAHLTARGLFGLSWLVARTGCQSDLRQVRIKRCRSLVEFYSVQASMGNG